MSLDTTASRFLRPTDLQRLRRNQRRIQVQRLRDGSRKTTHVSEITGMEGEVITMQDLFSLEIMGEDEHGKLITKQRSSGLRPKFFDKARQFGVDKLVMDAMEEAYD